MEKLGQEQLRGLQATANGLAGLKESLNGLVKAVSQKVDSLKVVDR